MGLVPMSPVEVSPLSRLKSRRGKRRTTCRGMTGSLCLIGTFLRRYILHMSGYSSWIVSSSLRLHAGVWADHPLLGPGRWIAIS